MNKRPAAPQITKGILKLSRQIDSTFQPELIDVEAGHGCEAGACFENVKKVVKMLGGSVQHGWKMREQPTMFAEGEFQAVWRNPEGRLVDVTPRTDGQRQIVFLPDSTQVWEGEEIVPRRLALREQPCYCGSEMPFNLCHGLADD